MEYSKFWVSKYAHPHTFYFLSVHIWYMKNKIAITIKTAKPNTIAWGRDTNQVSNPTQSREPIINRSTVTFPLLLRSKWDLNSCARLIPDIISWKWKRKKPNNNEKYYIGPLHLLQLKIKFCKEEKKNITFLCSVHPPILLNGGWKEKNYSIQT